MCIYIYIVVVVVVVVVVAAVVVVVVEFRVSIVGITIILWSRKVSSIAAPRTLWAPANHPCYALRKLLS